MSLETILRQERDFGVIRFAPVKSVKKNLARKKPPFLTLAVVVLFASMFLVAALVSASQRDGDVATRFPGIQRVTADYPDDAERFIVFNLLFNWLGEKTPGRQSKAAYELYSAYARSQGEILSKYEQQGRSSEVFKQFDARSGELFTDRRFRQSVLDRYSLASVAVEGAGTKSSTDGPLFPENGDQSDAAIQSAFLEAAPVWFAGLLGMIALAWVLMRSSGCAIAASNQRGNAPGNLPQLPESLRVVSVPGRRYEVEAEYGQVIEKETTMHNRFQTTTTAGPGHVQDGVLYQPVQTQTTVSTTQEDLLWVRTTDGREASWKLFGGALQTRQGHILSSIVRPLRDGTRDFLLAYNHTTGQLVDFGGLQTVHAAYGILAWILVALLGSLPGAFGLGMMFHRLGGMPSASLTIQLATLWIMGGFASALIASLVVIFMKRRIHRRRNAAFASSYLPQYREFLAQATPALAKHFNS